MTDYRQTRRGCLASLLAAGFVMPSLEGAAPRTEESVVWEAGEGGYHTYRIPAVLASGNGDLLAFCEGRKENARDHGDIDLLLKRSTDGGRTWSAQQMIYEEGNVASVTIGNPCPVLHADSGRVILPFCRNNDQVLVISSSDDGQSWSEPVDITATVKKPNWSWYATGPGVGIEIREGRYRGRLVIPCDHREDLNGTMVKMSHVFYSDDAGRSWLLGGTVAPHTDECQVAEISGGRLLINMRNYWERDGKQADKGGMRTSAISRDGGATWSELRFEEALVEPVCQASLIRVAGGSAARGLLAFSNPADKQKRVRMTLKLSEDEGVSWNDGIVIHEGPSAYSSLVSLPHGVIGVLYERGVQNPYQQIVFARVSQLA